jgi:hypothetical protein
MTQTTSDFAAPDTPGSPSSIAWKQAGRPAISGGTVRALSAIPEAFARRTKRRWIGDARSKHNPSNAGIHGPAPTPSPLTATPTRDPARAPRTTKVMSSPGNPPTTSNSSVPGGGACATEPVTCAGAEGRGASTPTPQATNIQHTATLVMSVLSCRHGSRNAPSFTEISFHSPQVLVWLWAFFSRKALSTSISRRFAMARR